MQITVNNKVQEVQEQATVASLLETLSVKTRWFAVTRNGDFVRKEQYESIVLQPDDALQIITMMAGG